MLNSNIIWLMLGIILHTLFALSIFDIYFVSPIVDIEPIKLNTQYSKRVVIAVADGLRHDTFYDPHFMNGTNIISPFVFSKVFEGAYGTSLCSVPTESRPGHMSLFCGITEDPSAVLKGWSKNPVEVDCIINSTNSYLFGDLGITHPYAPHIKLHPENGHLIGYDHKHYIDGFPQYDFKSDYLKMNKYVRDGVFNLFHKAQSNATLFKQLHEQSFFFFHFCGVDSAGHAFRPHSLEYINTVKQVDNYLEEISVLFNAFYGTNKEEQVDKVDEDTTWIYTADHGMGDMGSHGDDHPDSVKTPFVIWGPHIQPMYHSNHHELLKYRPFYNKWLIDNKLQYNIQNDKLPSPATIHQIDIASLAAISLGSSIPSNNLGTLPYLFFKNDAQYPALLSNYHQLLNLLNQKEHEKQLQNRYWYFQPFNNTIPNPTASIPQLLKSIKSLVDGIQYYQTYDKLFVQVLVTLGYILWFKCILLKFTTNGQLLGNQFDIHLSMAVWLFAMILIGFRASTYKYMAYILIDTVLITVLIPLRHDLTELLTTRRMIEIVICILWTLALSQAYMDSTTISYFYLVIGPLYLLFSGKINNLIFCISALGLAIFPLLPIPSTPHVVELTISSIVACFIGFVVVQRNSKESRIFGIFQLICALISIILVNDVNQETLAWVLLFLPILSAVVVKMGDFNNQERIIHVYLGLLPIYILLSLQYEPLFLSILFLMLYNFYLIEQDANEQQKQDGIKQRLYLRLAMFFLLFINTAFFSTGNIASFGSFSLASIYRFTTKFDPFLMGMFLILKILIPFILTSTAIYGIAIIWDIAPIIVYFISIAFSDIITIRYFYLIKTQGSWLEMGTSMTQYLIASLFILVLLMLYGVAKMILKNKEWRHNKSH